jgi:hypothetical protein
VSKKEGYHAQQDVTIGGSIICIEWPRWLSVVLVGYVIRQLGLGLLLYRTVRIIICAHRTCATNIVYGVPYEPPDGTTGYNLRRPQRWKGSLKV